MTLNLVQIYVGDTFHRIVHVFPLGNFFPFQDFYFPSRIPWNSILVLKLTLCCSLESFNLSNNGGNHVDHPPWEQGHTYYTSNLGRLCTFIFRFSHKLCHKDFKLFLILFLIDTCLFWMSNAFLVFSYLKLDFISRL